MKCQDCGSMHVVIRNEIYQECITSVSGSERCVAVVVPVQECLACGFRILTEEGRNQIDHALFDAVAS